MISVFQHIIHLLLEGLLVYKGKTATSPTQFFADHVALALRELGFHVTNSLFHLLSVILAHFQEMQANINVTTAPKQLPAFSQTGIHARTHARARTHTRGLRCSGMWRCLTGWLVPAAGPHIHSITPVTFLATHTMPEVATCTLTSPSSAFSRDGSLGSRLITCSKTKSSVVATHQSTADPRMSTAVTVLAGVRPEKGNGAIKPHFCNNGTQLANTYNEVQSCQGKPTVEEAQVPLQTAGQSSKPLLIFK